MEIPHRGHPIWMAIIEGKVKIEISYLAANIFIGRTRLLTRKDPSELPAYADKLWELYAKNPNLPSVKKDIANLSSQ